MVKTLLATGALLVGVVAGGTYVAHNGCPFSNCCAPAQNNDDSEGTDPSPSDIEKPITQTVAAGCAESCCASASRSQLLTSTPNTAAPKAAAPTVVTVEGLDCPSCAKKLVAKVNALTGVAKAEADCDKGTLTVAARDRATVSPRLLWDTIEKEGYTPKRIVTPNATFSARPRD